MKWSVKLGSFAGIRVYVHWTFVLLLGWILLSHVGQGHAWTEKSLIAPIRERYELVVAGTQTVGAMASAITPPT